MGRFHACCNKRFRKERRKGRKTGGKKGGKKGKKGGRRQKRFGKRFKSLKGCKMDEGVYTCPIGDASPCMPGWALNADATWEPASEYTCKIADGEDGDVRLFQDSGVVGSWRTSPPIFVASMAAMAALFVASAVGLRRRKVQAEEQDEEMLMANE